MDDGSANASSTNTVPDCTALSPDTEKVNVLRSSLQKGDFICTAELVLGRDHNAVEAETFVKQAEQSGIRIISLTDLPRG